MRLEIIPGVIIALWLSSCDSGVEIEHIPAEELFSVSSFISPQDTLFQVYLFKAVKLRDTTGRSYESAEAEVVISDETGAADTLFFVPGSGRFGVDRYETAPKNVAVQESYTYFLNVRTSTGANLSASCRIPPKPEQPEVAGRREDDNFFFDVNWHDPYDHKYFVLVTFAEGKYEYQLDSDSTQTDYLKARLLEHVLFPSADQTENNTYKGVVPYAYRSDSPKLTIYLRNVEENFFRYFDSYYKYDEWDENNLASFLPSFREPAPVFSNVAGGVGIFAGFNQAMVEADLTR